MGRSRAEKEWWAVRNAKRKEGSGRVLRNDARLMKIGRDALRITDQNRAKYCSRVVETPR